MEAQSFTKILTFEQDLVWHDFIGENLRQNLARDLISGQNVGFRANVGQTFAHLTARKNLAPDRRDFVASRLYLIHTTTAPCMPDAPDS